MKEFYIEQMFGDKIRMIEKIRSNKQRSIIIASLLLTYLFIIIFSQSSHLYRYDLYPDINVFLAIGKAINNGRLAYIDIYDHKGPLLFFLYQGISLLDNNGYIGVFIFEVIIYSIITISNCKILEYKLSKSYINIIIVLVLNILYFTSTSNESGPVPELFLLAIITFISYYELLDRSNNTLYLIIIGLCIGIFIFTKINLVICFVSIFAYHTIYNVKRKRYKDIAKEILIYTFTILIIALITMLWVYKFSTFDAFIKAYIFDNISYGTRHTTDRFKSVKILCAYILSNIVQTSIILFGGILLEKDKKTKIYNYIICIPYIMHISVLFNTAILYYALPLYYLMANSIINIYTYVNNRKHAITKVLCITVLIAAMIFRIYNSTNLLTLKELQHTIGQDEIYSIVGNESVLVLSKECNSIYIKNDITPNTKYFVIFDNFTSDRYTEIVLEQNSYIHNKEIKYIISAEEISDSNYKLILKTQTLFPKDTLAIFKQIEYKDCYLYELSK